MKPSERIEQIKESLTIIYIDNEDYTRKQIERYLTAIMQYLDEQYEKNPPCEHEQAEYTGGFHKCKKCGINGIFDK